MQKSFIQIYVNDCNKEFEIRNTLQEVKMKYKSDWEQTKKRFNEYWSRENHDRPILHIKAVRNEKQNLTVLAPESMEQRWLDSEYIIKAARAEFESTYFAAESFPVINPNLGPDIFAAAFGCDLTFEITTSYSKPIVSDWTTHPKLQFDKSNIWWEKISKLTKDLVSDSAGDYIVGITDLHPGMDGLVSLRGPGNLCMDLYDFPEEVDKRNFELFEGFKKQFKMLCEITSSSEGCTNWMNVWKEDDWYITSCDFCGMLSTDMFEKFVIPELEEELKYLEGKSIFHLDGPGALKHLDRLLELENLAGIQWVYGAGQPTAKHWIKEYRKIQAMGKLLHTYVQPDDIEDLLQNLKPEGVMLAVDERLTEDEANNLLGLVKSTRKKGVY